jgi:undecaprenyl-phosphate 4-deoxy-4-formamido-L-arabinose transferase
MDDDIQHSPFEINLLLNGLVDGVDVVYGKFKNRNHAYWKILGSKFNNLVAGYLIQKPKELYLSPFRAMRKSIALDIIKYKGPYVYVDGLILSVTRSFASVEVNHYGRSVGASGYSFGKSLSLWLKMATNFSIAPLRLTSLAGIFFAGLGFLFAILFIIQKFMFNLMPNGWSSLMVAILIIGGMQLLALGMIGEYLGRVLLTINQKPQYVLAGSINVHQADDKIKNESSR